jgi:hypothetical protein
VEAEGLVKIERSGSDTVSLTQSAVVLTRSLNLISQSGGGWSPVLFVVQHSRGTHVSPDVLAGSPRTVEVLDGCGVSTVVPHSAQCPECPCQTHFPAPGRGWVTCVFVKVTSVIF